MAFTMASKPFCSWRTITFSGEISASSSNFSTVNFSHPSATTITCPPKFGWCTRLRKARIGTFASGALIATPHPYAWLIGTTSSTCGYFGSSSSLILFTATLSTPVTHWTVVLIPRIFLVPAYPPLGFLYPSNVVTGGVGRSVTIFFPYSISSTDGGVGSSNINSLIQSPFSISSRAYPRITP